MSEEPSIVATSNEQVDENIKETETSIENEKSKEENTEESNQESTNAIEAPKEETNSEENTKEQTEDLKDSSETIQENQNNDKADGEEDQKDRGLGDMIWRHNAEDFNNHAQIAIPCKIIAISGCQDSQTSSDVSNIETLRAGLTGAGGACTQTMLSCLESYKKGDNTTIGGLLRDMHDKLGNNNFAQIPVLSTSYNFDAATEPLIISHHNTERGDPSNKKFVCIGVNYIGSPYELSGCQNDAKSLVKYLKECGFEVENPAQGRLLMDDGHHEAPTGKAILAAFKWLAESSKEGDIIFLSFAGHGMQKPDTDGDEVDHKDEMIMPSDFQTFGGITDDDIMKDFVLRMHPNAHVFCLFDCCHSGTCIDLPYIVPVSKMKHAYEKSREISMEPNEGFKFQKFLRLADENTDDIDESTENGFSRLAAFKRGFMNVFPVI